MPIELVVDTNVLVHAGHRDYKHQDFCIEIINTIIENREIFVCLDESLDGHIYYEYKKHLKFGSLGAAMLIKISSRIRFISRNIPPAINKKINQTGIKPADRIFVRISYKTLNKILVTEEHEDFTTKIRDIIKKGIGVKVIMAHECLGLLKSA